MKNSTEATGRRKGIHLFYSLKARLMTGLGLLMAGAFIANYIVTHLGIPAIGLEGSFQHSQSEVFKSLSLTADLKKEHLERWLHEQKVLTKLIAEENEIRAGVNKLGSVFRTRLKAGSGKDEITAAIQAEKEYEDILTHLKLFSRTLGTFDEIEILDPYTYEILVSTNESKIGEKISYFADYYRRLPGYDESLIFVPYDSANMKYHLHIARLIMSPETESVPAGILVLHIHTSDFLPPLLMTGGGLGKTGEVLLVNEDRQILTSLMKPLKDGTKAIPLEYIIEAQPAKLAARGEEGIINSEDYSGETVLAAYRHIRVSKDEGWGMVVKRDRAEVFGPIYRSQQYELIVALSAIVFLFIITNFIVTRLTAPIHDLSSAAYQIGEGDLSVRAEIFGTPEVRDLAVAFNSMIERVQDWHRALETEVKIRTEELENEIKERKMAEEALMKSEEQYRTLIHSATDAIISADALGKITSWNRAAEEVFGYPEKEAVGMKVTNLMPQSYREAHIQGMEKLLKTGKEKIIGKTVEVEGIRKDGETFPVEISLASWKTDDHVNFTAIIRDITERQKLEAQIHHTQKLESLGILAGGIAHDFNNLLMGILGNASLALPRIPDDNPAHLNIERIEQAAIRASDLTNQMLAYSGKGKFIVGIMDINEIVEEMSQLLTSSVGKKCGIYYNLSSEPVTVEGSSAQMQQLIMNLITNASDAIGDNKGSITITTGIRKFDSDSLTSVYFAEVPPEGMYSFINVSDTGKGMDKETLEKLFDPFYTTKEVGSGLGLAAALGIVRGHWGTIQVKSKPGEGANFRILLPYTKPDETTLVEDQPPDKTVKWKGSGTVLIVDDEEYVRDVVTNILEECGLTVILAQDGAEGLEVFGKMGKEIDLVLLDMTMPEKSGREVFTELRDIDRNVKVILSSGYVEQEVCAEIIDEYGDVEFIQKPYKAGALVEVVRQVID